MPHPSIEWQLRKTYENLRIEDKVIIARNYFYYFSELKIVGREWETKLAKSEIRGKKLSILYKDDNKNV